MIEIFRAKISELNEDTTKKVVDVFNSAFSTNPGSILREEKSWIWRYKERPNSENDQIILAKSQDEIVGTIVVTFREIKVGNKIIKMGMIDDVAAIPEFRGRGISRKMLEEATNLMEEKKCDASALYADSKGYPRKIYQSFGYEDIYYFQNFLLPAHPYQLFKDIPFFFFLLPFYYIFYLIVRSKLRFIRCNLKIEKLNIEEIEDYTSALNNFYSDFPIFSKEYLLWKHFKTPHQNILLVARDKEKIVGGISLIVQECRFSKYKLKIGYINELFFENKILGLYLINKILEYTKKEKIPVISGMSAFNNKKNFSFFKNIPSLKIGKGVFMLKNITSCFTPDFKYLPYIMNEHAIGIP